MNPRPETNPRVLFVEDDAAITTVMTRYLAASGYETQAVASVDAALRSFSESRPDIIVTDIFFAGDGDDGFALIERVRESDPDLPIIAVSGGRAGFDVLAQAAKIGANATIEKPFSAAYLVDTIDRCLEAQVSGA
jgi:DNA-binding NtrC family response regulator